MRTVAAITTLTILAGAALGQSETTLDADRAFAAELAADAEFRTSLQGGGPSGGFDGKGFRLTDGGPNTLYIKGFAQTRYTMNFVDDGGDADTEELTSGFQMRRARLGAEGTIWSKNLSYGVWGEFSKRSGSFGLLDAFGQYKFENDFTVRWGQFKFGFLREENTSDVRLLAVDRTTITDVFGQGRSQGVELGRQWEQVRFKAGFSDGVNTLNTDYSSSAEADYAINARIEFRWGEASWNAFDDHTGWKGGKYGGMVGGGVWWQSGGETGGTADTDTLLYTLDATAEGSGWNFQVAFAGRNTEPAGGDDFNDLGYYVQGGVFVSDQVELFAQWEHVMPDDDRTGGSEDWKVARIGVNYYVSPQSHAFKIVADAAWAFDAQADSGSLIRPGTGADWIASSEDDQIQFRLQAQIVY